MPLTPQPAELNVLNRLQGGLAVRLYANNLEPSAVLALADLVEATFDGYAPLDPAPFSPPELDDDSGELVSTCAPNTWDKGPGIVGNTIYGWYVTMLTTGGTMLVGVERFRYPFDMTVEGKFLSFAPTLNVTEIPDVA